MNINEIQDLIKFVAKAGVNEVEIEKKDFKLVIKSDYMAKKKTNFKEETKIVQQISPVGSIPQTMVQPTQVVAEVSSPVEKKPEKNLTLV
jgi:acetyl-CoA carboxylase biotin carboxyl carrier protein